MNIVQGLRDPASHTLMFGPKDLARGCADLEKSDPEPAMLSTGKFFKVFSCISTVEKLVEM